MTQNNDRVISISLSDDMWKAFTKANPEPVMWLKARIQESIESAQAPSAPARPIGRA